MAKVLFIMKFPLVDAYSLKNKFNGQLRAAEALGHEVYFIGYDHENTYLIHKEEKTVIKNIWFGNWKQYIHTKAFLDMYDSVRRVIKKEKFDVVYIRRCPLSYNGYQMCMDIVRSGAKLVEEIPTYPGGGERRQGTLRELCLDYSRSWWRKVHPHLSLYTLIGDKADAIDEIPAINIENGTDVELLPLRQPHFDEDKIHLLALASMCRWHGYDRLIRGLGEAPEEIRQSVIVDMVGDDGDGSLNQWKTLVQELGLGEQVVFHSRKEGAELNCFFDIADLGICSLGLYRIGFASGSILKLREYISRGLPFVYAAEDPSVSTEQPFCLQIPNDDSAVDVSAVIAFARQMRKDKELPAQMRQYAKVHMSWEVQMQKVFSALGIESESKSK